MMWLSFDVLLGHLYTKLGEIAVQNLCPWNSPGKNTGVGCHAFLQRIFPTLGSNLSLLWLDSLDLLAVECKSRKSRNTWNNRQIWPWNMEWSRAKTNRVLPRKCTGHSKHPLPTTQEKTLHVDITKQSTLKSDWLCSLQPKMEKLYTVNKNKTRSWLWLRPWTPYCQIQT